jgi:hypothetical protein
MEKKGKGREGRASLGLLGEGRVTRIEPDLGGLLMTHGLEGEMEAG